MTDLITTYEEALEAIADGEDDWATLTSCLPRNERAGVLAEVVWSLDTRQRAHALTEAWVMCEFPERAIDRSQWIEWFRSVGYTDNGECSAPPKQVVLYRGGVDANRMAWTSNRLVAEWFRDRFPDRFPDARLWTATVSGDCLLARSNDESGRNEDEYVIDPAGIQAEVIG